MAISEIKIDQVGLNKLNSFMRNVVKTVGIAAAFASKKTADHIKQEFREILRDDNMRGPLITPDWEEAKARAGLKTSRLQRFGEGDSRSYFENVVTRPMRNGWFVGVLKSAKSYNMDGSRSGEQLIDIVRNLEERWPVWQQIFDKTGDTLRDTLFLQIMLGLRELGAGDAG